MAAGGAAGPLAGAAKGERQAQFGSRCRAKVPRCDAPGVSPMRSGAPNSTRYQSCRSVTVDMMAPAGAARGRPGARRRWAGSRAGTPARAASGPCTAVPSVCPLACPQIPVGEAIEEAFRCLDRARAIQRHAGVVGACAGGARAHGHLMSRLAARERQACTPAALKQWQAAQFRAPRNRQKQRSTAASARAAHPPTQRWGRCSRRSRPGGRAAAGPGPWTCHKRCG